ncbi:MAG: DUF3307 domain-containing protein [Flavitalea sp.]
MIIEQLWLLKLLLAHLLTDFILQPKSWVVNRTRKHFLSPKLYVHGLLTGAVALAFIGLQYWMVVAIITVLHIIIDGWKSYQPPTLFYFITDQVLHMLVIATCWYFTFIQWSNVTTAIHLVKSNNNLWALVTAVIFLTAPAGILIGQMTMRWREKIVGAESLANAGKWIGIIERLIVFILVMLGQYAAISLLIAAKGIIRFNEKDRPEVKTEYLVIGTLLSIGLAMITGIILRHLLV